jgi:hypothetical protein
MQQLELYVEGVDIIVTMPGTKYTVTYYKPDKSPQLYARLITAKDDPRAPVNLSQFIGAAWRAANAKARELGWIV